MAALVVCSPIVPSATTSIIRRRYDETNLQSTLLTWHDTDSFRPWLDLVKKGTAVASSSSRVSQCQKPTGWLGRFVLWRMNVSHSTVTDWGLQHISVEKHHTILDVGCGGGRTVRKLAANATYGKTYGVDHSEEAVAASKRTNASGIEKGRIDIRLGSVSRLPFSNDMFDLVTAVETHFWWSDLSSGMREIFRVLKPDGQLIIIAEVYKGAHAMASRLVEKSAGRTGLTLLSAEEHRQLFASAGYLNVQLTADDHKGWICTIGRKPSSSLKGSSGPL